MHRTSLTVSEVTPELEAEFTQLWTTACVEAGATKDWAHRSTTAARVTAARERSDVRLHLARSGDEPVGYIVLTQSPLSGLSEAPGVWIDQLYVAPSARRTGVAKLLLNTAARYAEELGADQVATCVPSQQRDGNRFFARLGFSSSVVRRVTSTANLRRRLAGDQLGAATVVVQRRRSLRARSSRSAARFAR